MNLPRKLPIGARLRHWHRRLGITAAVFLIWLAISGIALNEGAALGLDRIKVGGRFLSAVYGLKEEGPHSGFVSGNHCVVSTELGTLLDGQLLQPELSDPVGLVSDSKMIYVGLKDGLALFTAEGQLIEILRSGTLPIPALRRIGLSEDRRIVIEGQESFASADGENWSRFAAGPVAWSQQVDLSAAQQQQAAAALRPQFPLSRVLADAHSGRLFGRYGHWFIDAVGLAALLLAITGGWIYLRAVRRQHH